MAIKFRLFQVLAPAILMIVLCLVSGCYFANDDGARTERHKSDNDRAVELARIGSDERIAQFNAGVAKHEATESTNRIFLAQQGSSERLLIQSNHMLTVRSMDNDKFYAALMFFAAIIVAVGGGWLFIYLRNNPRPVILYTAAEPPKSALPKPVGRLTQSETETATGRELAVPYSVFTNDPKFAQYGWREHDKTTGVRVDENGRIVQTCRLLEG